MPQTPAGNRTWVRRAGGALRPAPAQEGRRRPRNVAPLPRNPSIRHENLHSAFQELAITSATCVHLCKLAFALSDLRLVLRTAQSQREGPRLSRPSHSATAGGAALVAAHSFGRDKRGRSRHTRTVIVPASRSFTRRANGGKGLSHRNIHPPRLSVQDCPHTRAPCAQIPRDVSAKAVPSPPSP